jgi:hypothetical protein
MLKLPGGASQVEVVHDLEAAFFDLEQYDAIVNEDDDLPASLLKFSKSKKGREVICADISCVRDCLITGCSWDIVSRSKSLRVEDL